MHRLMLAACAVFLCAPGRCSVCGNGRVEAPEACDDGNRAGGDGCSTACAREPGFLCPGVAMVDGGVTSACCLSRVNPVTWGNVCSCEGQASGSPAWRVSAACEVEDVDECRVGNGACAPGAVCANLDGRGGGPGRACVCPEGLHGDGVVACDAVAYGAMMALGVAPPLSLSWMQAQVEGLFAADPRVGGVSVAFAAVGRRLAAGAYDHVTVTLQVADWDTMVAVAADVNAELLAQFLAAAAGGLYQIAVLQETTTIVDESPSDYTFVAADVPGFVLRGASLSGAWVAGAQTWRLDAHFHAPAELAYGLFVTRHHAGAAPHEHACAVETDVCCLYRMTIDHDLGDLGAWVTTNLSPLCSAPGGFPDAATADKRSDDVLSGLPRLAWTEGITGVTATVVAPGVLQIDLPQATVRDRLAVATATANGTRFAFAAGMIFLRPLAAPELYSAIGQTRIEVFASETASFVVMSEQEYSFLEFIDVAVHEVHRPVGPPAQFARVSFALPPELAGGTVPANSISILVASNVALAPHLPWTSPCADGGATLADAMAQTCAPTFGSFCVATHHDYLLVLDVPLGNGVLAPGELLLRFLVTAERDVGGVPQEVLTRVDLQILVDDATALRACGAPLESLVYDTDYVAVSVGVGVQLTPIAGDLRDTVVFSDVTATVDYRATGAFDLGARYAAVSVLDSILTVALQGDPIFFEAEEHSAYAVAFDHVVAVHVRSDAKYAALSGLVAAGAAYTSTPNAAGFWEISLSDAFLGACQAPAADLDCVVQHPVVDRAVVSPLARLVTVGAAPNVAWLLGLLGTGDFVFDTAATLTQNTDATFGLNSRYRRALWLVPAYAWPGADALGTTDRALVFFAFAIVRS